MENEEERELPVLGWISAFLRWVEEFVVLVSGPMLTVGLGIGLVALLSDGKLLVDAPWLTYAWAISQTIGVDGQLVGAWYRVSQAVRQKRWFAAVAFAVLGLILAYVGFVAALIFAMQEAYHLTTAQALVKLGLDSTSWLWQRAFVAVFLVCLSGYLRYRPQAKRAPVSLEERKRALQEQMELDAILQQRAAQRMQGRVNLGVNLGKGLLQVARSSAGGASSADAVTQAETVAAAANAEREAEREEVSAGAVPLR